MKTLKPACVDVDGYFNLESRTSFGFNQIHKTLELKLDSHQIAVGFNYNVQIEPGKKPQETFVDTSAQRVRKQLTFFPDFIKDLEKDGPYDMEAVCSFAFNIKTKNMPLNYWRRAARIATRPAMSGSLKLFEIYPRLFQIQKWYGLNAEPTAKYRITAHLMDGGDSLRWHAYEGNSGQELYEAMMAKPPLLKRGMRQRRSYEYMVTVHGHECDEKEALYIRSWDKNYQHALIEALNS